MSSSSSFTIPTFLAVTYTNDSNSVSTGSLVISGGVGISKNISGTTISLSNVLTSTVSTGIAPFVISSTTNVPNLNCSFLNGSTFASPGAIGSVIPSSGAFSSISASGVIISTIASGTAPFTISSTTNIPNLNASYLNDKDFSSPGSIGNVIASSGAFTTLSVTNVITSTVSSGTAPFSITSTTVVPNLNVNFLNGSTFAIPSSIGSTTPNSGAFTTLTASNTIDSSSVSTGSLVVSGGVGIAKKLYVGTFVNTPNMINQSFRLYTYNGTVANGNAGVLTFNFNTISSHFHGKVTITQQNQANSSFYSIITFECSGSGVSGTNTTPH